MITCTKTYRDIPLSHRQPLHSGRCSRLHGHSWAITLTFVAKEMDDNGFVIDFGDLHFLRDWIDDNLDHATALKVDDPMRVECEQLQQQGPSPSQQLAMMEKMRGASVQPQENIEQQVQAGNLVPLSEARGRR